MKSKGTYIAVTGSMAVGKSTLIRQLSTHFYTSLELSEKNPYIDKQANTTDSTYLSQLYFLTQRFKCQLCALNNRVSIVERTIFEDAEIFAKYWRENGYINDNNWDKYSTLYNAFCDIIKHPNLIIFIDSTPELTNKLIKTRGRNSEKEISIHFIDSILTAYRAWIDHVDYCPVITLHTKELIENDCSLEIFRDINRHLPAFVDFN